MSIKKINVISRNPDTYLRETKQDIHKVPRNYDPDLHPFEAAREYKLAINAVKLERTFAKPFLGALVHRDSVVSMCRHPQKVSSIFTGTVEGQLTQWDLMTRKSSWGVQAHNGQVWAITASPDGSSFFTVGNDKTIKRWSLEKVAENTDVAEDTWLSDTIITGITHHRYKNEFVTCGERVLLWDAAMKAPKFSYDWNTSGDSNDASVSCVRFNHVEKDLFAASDQANNIILYDTRAKDVKKLKMQMRINSLTWNPMEAFILTAASDDYNCYTFDIRNMKSADRVLCIHGGHTCAVIDVYYSPTGKEFVSGSFDKSLRIFGTDQRTSREVYHTKRMFKLNCVLWTADNKYLLSGSSDHNVRLWKARASEKLGVMERRERAAMNYAEELKEKYGHFPEVKRIKRHRHLPKHIYHARNEHRIIKEKASIREANRRKHSKPGSVPYVAATKKPVVGLVDEADDDDEDSDE